MEVDNIYCWNYVIDAPHLLKVVIEEAIEYRVCARGGDPDEVEDEIESQHIFGLFKQIHCFCQQTE